MFASCIAVSPQSCIVFSGIMCLLELSRGLTCMLFEYLSEVSVIAETHSAGYLRHLQRCTAQKLLCLVYAYICQIVDKVHSHVLFEKGAEICRTEVNCRSYAL